MKWPFVKRKTMEAAVASERQRAWAAADKKTEQLESEWRQKWEPLLKDAIALRARSKPDLSSFVLSIGVDRGMLEMAAMRNDAGIWDYIADNLSHEFKRQIATLNFTGLHRLARENEYRYPSVSAYPR